MRSAGLSCGGPYLKSRPIQASIQKKPKKAASSLLILYVSMAVLFFLGRIVLAKSPENPGIDHALNRIPWISSARRNMAMSRFCKVYVPKALYFLIVAYVAWKIIGFFSGYYAELDNI